MVNSCLWTTYLKSIIICCLLSLSLVDITLHNETIDLLKLHNSKLAQPVFEGIFGIFLQGIRKSVLGAKAKVADISITISTQVGPCWTRSTILLQEGAVYFIFSHYISILLLFFIIFLAKLHFRHQQKKQKKTATKVHFCFRVNFSRIITKFWIGFKGYYSFHYVTFFEL